MIKIKTHHVNREFKIGEDINPHDIHDAIIFQAIQLVILSLGVQSIMLFFFDDKIVPHMDVKCLFSVNDHPQITKRPKLSQ